MISKASTCRQLAARRRARRSSRSRRSSACRVTRIMSMGVAGNGYCRLLVRRGFSSSTGGDERKRRPSGLCRPPTRSASPIRVVRHQLRTRLERWSGGNSAREAFHARRNSPNLSACMRARSNSLEPLIPSGIPGSSPYTRCWPPDRRRSSVRERRARDAGTSAALRIPAVFRLLGAQPDRVRRTPTSTCKRAYTHLCPPTRW